MQYLLLHIHVTSYRDGSTHKTSAGAWTDIVRSLDGHRHFIHHTMPGQTLYGYGRSPLKSFDLKYMYYQNRPVLVRRMHTPAGRAPYGDRPMSFKSQ